VSLRHRKLSGPPDRQGIDAAETARRASEAKGPLPYIGEGSQGRSPSAREKFVSAPALGRELLKRGTTDRQIMSRRTSVIPQIPGNAAVMCRNQPSIDPPSVQGLKADETFYPFTNSPRHERRECVLATGPSMARLSQRQKWRFSTGEIVPLLPRRRLETLWKTSIRRPARR